MKAWLALELPQPAERTVITIAAKFNADGWMGRLILFACAILASLLLFGCAQTNDVKEPAKLVKEATNLEDIAYDLTGVTYSYAQLVALNQPIECTIKESKEEIGMEGTSIVYIKGDKILIDNQGYENKTGHIYRMRIIYADATYVRTSVINTKNGDSVGEDPCWRKYDIPCMGAYIKPNPARPFDCKFGQFGDEKFVPDGNVCKGECPQLA